MRSLFAQVLGYSLPQHAPLFGLDRQQFLLPPELQESQKYLVFLHGTTWATKEWPQSYWVELAELARLSGYRVKISSGHKDEIKRAMHLAKESTVFDVIENLDIARMATLLANAQAVVAVDTGFGHLAAALDVPTVSIYGPTHPGYTGALGKKSIHLAANFSCAPCLRRRCTYQGQEAEVTPACYTTVKPAKVWEAVLSVI
jgi:heptosyltransferase-1